MAKIIVNDNSGKKIVDFQANTEESIGTQVQENGVPIPFSCGVGACRSCVCRVKQGKEFLNEEAVGPKHITTEDDEVLSCICGIREDAPENAEIELEVENL